MKVESLSGGAGPSWRHELTMPQRYGYTLARGRTREPRLRRTPAVLARRHGGRRIDAVSRGDTSGRRRAGLQVGQGRLDCSTWMSTCGDLPGTSCSGAFRFRFQSERLWEKRHGDNFLLVGRIFRSQGCTTVTGLAKKSNSQWGVVDLWHLAWAAMGVFLLTAGRDGCCRTSVARPAVSRFGG